MKSLPSVFFDQCNLYQSSHRLQVTLSLHAVFLSVILGQRFCQGYSVFFLLGMLQHGNGSTAQQHLHWSIGPRCECAVQSILDRGRAKLSKVEKTSDCAARAVV